MTCWRQICFSFATVSAISLLSACAALDPEATSDSPRMTVGAGAPVPVAGETQAVATLSADAADDPEIWADPKDPGRAVIFGTDKQAGLYVYNLDGSVRQFLKEGPLNNVDLRGGFTVDGREQVLVGVSDRARMGVALYLFDPATLETRPWGVVPVAVSEPYGFCMGRLGEAFVAVLIGKDGDVKQLNVTVQDGRPVARETRSFAVGSQSEGCVVDDATGALYVGEEAKGIWRYGLDPAAGDTRAQLAAAPSAMLTPDVEGLTLLKEGAKTWLIASSQGDSAFAVWRVDGAEPVYAGRFSPVAANGVDNVTGTDGVAALGGPVGTFPEGLIVTQDDVDTEGEAVSATRVRQNYKLIDWRAVKRALGLP